MDPFLSEIRPFGFNFAPTTWAQCNGQLIPITQNTALFSLLGTYYGGDGKSTFALPNLQGSAPMHRGTRQDNTQRFLGEQGGSVTETLIQSEIPVHTHTLNASDTTAVERQPPDQMFGVGEAISFYAPAGGATTNLAPNFLSPTGGSLPHNNLQPSLVINFCIAMQGVYPPRQ